MIEDALLQQAPLGKATTYQTTYDPSLLFAIPRAGKRQEIGVSDPLPFHGYDIWNAYELSWLNNKGKPQVAVAEIKVPCASANIFESKSCKLYLNSFTQTSFARDSAVSQALTRDLSQVVGANVTVQLYHLDELAKQSLASLPGESIDGLDIEIDTYELTPAFLRVSDVIVEERLNSDLLKSNCLITNQPDWASVAIHYQGAKIDRVGLLRYLISFRLHNEFHEQCVERIFMDIQQRCKPQKLSVYARYTRRGGLDINPFRSNFASLADNGRLPRQ